MNADILGDSLVLFPFSFLAVGRKVERGCLQILGEGIIPRYDTYSVRQYRNTYACIEPTIRNGTFLRSV